MKGGERGTAHYLEHVPAADREHNSDMNKAWQPYFCPFSIDRSRSKIRISCFYRSALYTGLAPDSIGATKFGPPLRRHSLSSVLNHPNTGPHGLTRVAI